MKPKPSETAVKVILAGGSAVSVGLAVSRWLNGLPIEMLELYQAYGVLWLNVTVIFLLAFLFNSELNKR